VNFKFTIKVVNHLTPTMHFAIPTRNIKEGTILDQIQEILDANGKDCSQAI
jgi:hypothetical protein